MLRPAARATAGCTACRAHVLALFSSGNSSPSWTRAALRVSAANEAVLKSRCISSTAKRASQFPQSDAPTKLPTSTPSQEVSAKNVESTDKSEEAVTAADAEPWYLQVEPPRHATLTEERTPIPDVPEDSPEMMGPLLEYAYDDLGLDELNLLDLRYLDPAPALGPNLLMLFGTARSDRHLHVSADRLVRWARKYGIHANADGLLGRNELKIKLRRRARRARLLGNTGPTSGEDDGITTRWICVNLGAVGQSFEEAPIVGEDGRVSGFGSTQTGTTIVVQMFTEAKRREMDLETLWTRKLERSRKQAVAGNETEDAEHFDHRASSRATSHQSPARGAGKSTAPNQRRLFSTASRLPPAKGDSFTYKLLEEVLQVPEAEAERLLVHDAIGRIPILEELRRHISHLSHLPPKKAIAELSHGERKSRSSKVMYLCTRVLPLFPSAETWEFRSWLHATAMSLGHPEYGLSGFKALIQEMRLSGIEAPRAHYLLLLQAMFARRKGQTSVREASELALLLLETLYERGEPTLANDTIIALIEGIVKSGKAGPETQEVQTTLEKLMVQAKLPCPDEEELLRLLDAYATQGNWERFWETWRMPPRHGQPRSPRMYTWLYRHMAGTGHQAQCIDALRRSFHEMLHEDPPVRPTGAVLHALKACVNVADPQALSLTEEAYSTDAERTFKLRNREFVVLMRHVAWANSSSSLEPVGGRPRP